MAKRNQKKNKLKTIMIKIILETLRIKIARKARYLNIKQGLLII